jgi:hypothetical protein
VELRTINPTVELVLKQKKANMRKSEFLMLEALKSAPHLNNICVLLTWELHMDRHTHRQTDRPTDTQTNTQTDTNLNQNLILS